MTLNQPYYIEKREDGSHISLSGEWEFAYCDRSVEEISEVQYEMSATLPSSTYLNLNEAGILPNPYFGVNSHEYTWADTKVWYYKKNFELSKAPDSKITDAFLCFDGVGYYSKVWLNGELLGDHEGMFGGPVCNVADKLREGTNEIVVELKAFNYDKEGDLRFWRGYVPTGWRSKISEIVPWNVARDEETSNGDFNVFGIWREVRLEIIPKTHLARPYLYTKSLQGDKAEMALEISIATEKINELECILSAPDWHFTFSYFDGLTGALSNDTVTINVEFTDPDTGKKVYSEAEDYTLYDYEKCGVNEKFRECQFYRRDIKLEGIAPWYPNGMGEAKLYQVEISISKDGIILDTLKFNTGIRMIDQCESAGRKYRQRWDKYWFQVNGKKIFLKGMNWTPLDYLYNTDPKEYDWALEQVKNCGIQLLRVWSGGGMPEEDYFYDLCDKLGIMVWQDSFIANQNTPKWDELVLESQVCYNLYRIRNHPSLSAHCGGNEFSAYYWGNNASMFVIQRNLEDIDPTRKFYRTTPDRGSYHGYRNMDPSWLRKLFKELPFMAETGTHSFPNFKNLKQNIGEDEWYKKIDLTSDDLEKDFPHFANHLTEYKRNKCLIMRSRCSHIIDLQNSDLKTLSEGTQMSGYEYYQFAIQSFRENYPNTVGIMPWVFKRNWTTVAVQLVDGMGEPVAAYYSVKNSYKPKIVFASLENTIYAPDEEFTLPVKVINESDDVLTAKAVVEVFDNKLNKVLAKEANVTVTPEDYMKTALTADIKVNKDWTENHFYVRTSLYEGDKMISTSFYPLLCIQRMADKEFYDTYRAAPQENILFENGPVMMREIGETKSQIDVNVTECEKEGDRIHLKVSLKANAPAFPVMIKAVQDNTLSYESDNYFFMDKDEERIIDMEIRNKGELTRDIEICVSSWNSEDVIIKI